MPETAPLFKSALTSSAPTARRVPGFGSLQIDQVVPDARSLVPMSLTIYSTYHVAHDAPGVIAE